MLKFKVLSKEVEKSDYSDNVYATYMLELNDEIHTTPSGLSFRLYTIGSVIINSDQELDFNNPTHDFHSIQTNILDDAGEYLEHITGQKIIAGLYSLNGSILKAKRWLDKNGVAFVSGKGYQHKST